MLGISGHKAQVLLLAAGPYVVSKSVDKDGFTETGKLKQALEGFILDQLIVDGEVPAVARQAS